jgi:hypothetical protein
MIRCPMPASLTAPRELTLQAPGQYSPWHLPDPRVDPEPAQRRDNDLGEQPEAVVGVAGGPGVGARPGNRQRTLVKHGRSAAGEADDGVKARATRRCNRGRKARSDPILLRESKLAPGVVQP